MQMRRGEKVTKRKLEAHDSGYPLVTVEETSTQKKAAVRNKRKRERRKLMEGFVFVFSLSFLPIDLDEYPR